VTTTVGNPRINGFVERFNRMVLNEFFRKAFRKKFYESLEVLQADPDAWLNYYNHKRKRPHRGYRNKGRRLIETVEPGKKKREELIKKPACNEST
jgi:transposase InsO family protein